jgi:hypothetical protein
MEKKKRGSSKPEDESADDGPQQAKRKPPLHRTGGAEPSDHDCRDGG